MKSNEEWSSQLWSQFLQLRKEAWKKNSGLQRGLIPWPRDTGATLYQLSYESTDVGSRSILGSYDSSFDFLFVVTYQSVINCLIVHTITVSCFQSVKIILSTCHCHLSSRFLILWRLSSCCFPFSTSFLFDIFTWKTIFTDSWVFCKIQALLQTLIWLMSYARLFQKLSRCMSKKRLANAVQKNITDFFNAKWINNKELSLNTTVC